MTLTFSTGIAKTVSPNASGAGDAARAGLPRLEEEDAWLSAVGVKAHAVPGDLDDDWDIGAPGGTEDDDGVGSGAEHLVEGVHKETETSSEVAPADNPGAVTVSFAAPLESTRESNANRGTSAAAAFPPARPNGAEPVLSVPLAHAGAVVSAVPVADGLASPGADGLASPGADGLASPGDDVPTAPITDVSATPAAGISAQPASEDAKSNSQASTDDPLELLTRKLMQRVLDRFLAGDIALEEASSRLVGTGKFEENTTATQYLRSEVLPGLVEELRRVEEEMKALQIEARRISDILAGAGVVVADRSLENDTVTTVTPVGASAASQTATFGGAVSQSAAERARKPRTNSTDRKKRQSGAGEAGEDAARDEFLMGSNEETTL